MAIHDDTGVVFCMSGDGCPGEGDLTTDAGVGTAPEVGTSDLSGLGSPPWGAWAPPLDITWGAGTGTSCKGADRSFHGGGPVGRGDRDPWSKTSCSMSTAVGSTLRHEAPLDSQHKWDDDTYRTWLLQITLYDTLETIPSIMPGNQFSRWWVTDRTHTRSPTWKHVTFAWSASILFSLTSFIFHLRRLLALSRDNGVLGRRPRNSSAGDTSIVVWGVFGNQKSIRQFYVVKYAYRNWSLTVAVEGPP
jgi:hypothetical protein